MSSAPDLGHYWSPHVATLPTEENGGSAWWCRYCKQHCSSDNPCDHCHDDVWEWADAVD